MKRYTKDIDSCLVCPNRIRVIAENPDINYNPHLCHPMGRVLPSVEFVERAKGIQETAIIPPDWCPLLDVEEE